MSVLSNKIRGILSTWCETMLSLQIHSDNRRLNGALMCPACGKIHGRCFEAMYPFMEMAALTGEERWAKAAEDLFEWSENTVSLPSGGYINDIDSDWEGITVFACIAMLDALEGYSSLMGSDFFSRLHDRARAAAEYLYSNDALKLKNTNYPVTAALALYRAGKYFSDSRYIRKSEEYERIIYSVFTPTNTVFGEGRSRDMRSRKGLLAVDIGYNAEETLPSIAHLGVLKGDARLIGLAADGFRSALDFMLSDGGWDNSFGTRNFKWTYWGSRTSDGAAEALLMLSGYDRSFRTAAAKNIELMGKCTYDGLLAGGPDYKGAGQPVCVHHSFTHAKVLAGISAKGLADDMADGLTAALPRYEAPGLRYKEDTDSYVFSSSYYSATVTAYDWPYMKGGHISGGMLSLLEFPGYGPVIASSMGTYFMKERNNMQVPYGRLRHECLDFRLERNENGTLFSSIFCDTARLDRLGDYSIKASGILMSENAEDTADDSMYSVVYSFSDDGVLITAETDDMLVVPLIGQCMESCSGHSIVLERNGVSVGFDASVCSELRLPYGTEPVYNLVPGFMAIRAEVMPLNGVIELSISRRH